ncbi:hypothetical protein SCOR_11120 [Sulfidibacter corallicola]|uniref:Uncharacterized protein n=1 Tax=Sulfidibacter corallicola TaxID=2818388 RepID=A0A8A4TFY0_SULCO|nr:hypothetical protein [Sulfidibacter corallicola]QTD48114.1 hypothetical protein J3U87_21220 [Sulfidibacter corallicola]
MINLIFTALYEIVMSLRVTSLLQLMGIVIVVCLMSSPGACATVIGISAKLGIAQHAINKGKEKKA